MVDLLVKMFIPENTSQSQRREAVGRTAGIFGIACNIILCIIKVTAGILASSVSVIADAVNNLSDALSSVITVASFKLSGKPADEDHPYGHERLEYVATLLLAFFIIFIGYELCKTSLGRIFSPEEANLSITTVVILLISISLKLIMARVFGRFADMINSTVLKAAAKDSVNDVYSTLAVLLAMLIGAPLGIGLDGYAGIGVSLFIIWSGISLIKETLDPILGSVPDKSFTESIAAKVLSYDGVMGIHDLIVHSYGPNKTFASVHAEVDAHGDIMESHDIIDNIERDVASDMGIELIIHMDPIVTDDEEVLNARDIVAQIISDIDCQLNMHDFRMVKGHTHTNLIFDVVIPFGYRHTQKELGKLIQSGVFRTLGREYYCVINFDRNYTGM